LKRLDDHVVYLATTLAGPRWADIQRVGAQFGVRALNRALTSLTDAQRRRAGAAFTDADVALALAALDLQSRGQGAAVVAALMRIATDAAAKERADANGLKMLRAAVAIARADVGDPDAATLRDRMRKVIMVGGSLRIPALFPPITGTAPQSAARAATTRITTLTLRYTRAGGAGEAVKTWDPEFWLGLALLGGEAVTSLMQEMK
jgi:hypothetical protein